MSQFNPPFEANTMFNLLLKTAYELLARNGTFYVIPPYQRPYTWGKEEIFKMLNDIFEGYSLTFTKTDSIRFLGTILTTTGVTTSRMDERQQLRDMPHTVLSVIDGQQRMTTLILMLIALYGKLTILRKDWIDVVDSVLKKEKIEVQREALEEVKRCTEGIVSNVTAEIRTCVNEAWMSAYPTEEGTEIFPRLIRQMEDYWDRTKDSYSSAIASYIFQSMKHYREMEKKGQRIKPFSLKDWQSKAKESQREFYTTLSGAVKNIDEAFKVFDKTCESKVDVKEDHELFVAPDIDHILNQKVDNEQDALLRQTVFPDSVQLMLRSDSKEGKILRKLFQFSALSRYVMHRVVITTVNARDEDMAFDIFESLNTAGSPLTAIETFKPHVYLGDIKTEDILYKRMQDITSYLQDDKNVDATSLVQVFAFSEAGRAKLTRINQQRIFLNQYDKFDDTQKDKFIESLFNTKEFLEAFWGSDPDIHNISSDISKGESEELEFCITFLKSIKHERALGPIIRYFSQWRNLSGCSSSENARKKAASNFVSSVKACTAFTILWRAAQGGGTKGVDQEYLKIMNGSLDASFSAFCRQDKEHNEIPVPAISDLQGVFRKALEKKNILNRDQWVNIVSSTSYSDGFKNLAKVILLAAANDAEPGGEYNRDLVRGKVGCNPLIKAELYKDLTLEHISPQKREGKWKDLFHDETYNDNGRLLDMLGNYTLLNLPENSHVSNQDWDYKKTAYRVFSSGKLPEKMPGLSPEDVRRFDKYTKHLKWLEVISNSPYWGPDIIKERSTEVASMAYDFLIGWLQEKSKTLN